MPTLYIEEFIDLSHDSNGNVIQMPGVPLVDQKVTIGAASASSSALNTKTRFVMLWADTVCQWEEGAAPTADTNSRFLAANVPMFYPVTSGNLIAVIDQQ